MTFTCNFGLPGHVQTVASAEVQVLQAVPEHVNYGSNVTFITDNKLLHDTFYKGGEAAKNCVNADLYALIFDDIRDRELICNVKRMPSHVNYDENGTEIIQEGKM